MVTIARSGIAYAPTTGETSRFTSFRGLSTDEKPTDVHENSTFLEMDTGKGYYFSDGEWKVFGADSEEGTSIGGIITG